MLSETRSGWIWSHDTDAAEQQQRITARTLYSSAEVAAFNPVTEAAAIGVTLAYQGDWATWATLNQPAGRPKQTDGPLLNAPPENALDVSEVVYYPIDSSVPGPLQGRLAATKNPLGEVTFYDGYDQFGNPERIVDPRGVATERLYDGLGRLITSTLKAVAGCDTTLDPLCNQDLATVFQYEGTTGRQSLVTSPGVGNRRAYEHDQSWGRLEAIKRGPPTGAYLERILYEYPVDQVGTPVSGLRTTERYQAYETGAWLDRQVTSFTYDASDRLAATIYADGGSEEYTYDRAGDLVAFKDGIHSAPNVLYEHDTHGRLLKVKQLHDPSVDYPWAITSYGYDASGNLVSVMGANGNVTTYGVDDLGQTYETISGVTGTTEISHDHGGRLVKRVDARGVIEQLEYDDAGQVMSLAYSDGVSASQGVTYGYTSGLRTSANTVDLDGNSVVEAWAYDRRGLLLRHQRDLPDLLRSGAITYGYDAEGSELWHASRCTKVVQVLDYAGRATEIRVEPATVGCTGSTQYVAQSIAYLPFGPPASMTRGAVVEDLGYDQRYRMTSQLVSSAGGALFDRAYSYDQASNLLGVTDNLVPERSITYGYDDMSRLRSATRQPSTIKAWEYDLIGNRRYYGEAKDGAAQKVSEYDYGNGSASPKLVEVRTAELGQPDMTQSISYDAAGNILEDDISGYTYDLRSRLRLHSNATWTEDYVSYRYASNGWRVYSRSEDVNGSAIDAYLLPDAQPFVEVTLDASLTEVSEIFRVFLGNRLLARVSDGALHHVVSDQIGFPFAVVDDLAGLLWYGEADPFGYIESVLGGSAEQEPKRRYPGQWDVDSGLSGAPPSILYNTHRWYVPDWGRYAQADPIGLAGGPNLFAYGSENPLRFIDPLGLFVPGDVVYRCCGDKCDVATIVYDPTPLNDCDRAQTIAAVFGPEGGFRGQCGECCTGKAEVTTLGGSCDPYASCRIIAKIPAKWWMSSIDTVLSRYESNWVEDKGDPTWSYHMQCYDFADVLTSREPILRDSAGLQRYRYRRNFRYLDCPLAP